jgi:iron complex outermembrane receptor protein
MISRTTLKSKQKVQHRLKNYNYYFDETASLAVQYSFSLIRLEFDVRRGDFNDVAALDLG